MIKNFQTTLLSASWQYHVNVKRVLCIHDDDGLPSLVRSPSNLNIRFINADCDDEDESEQSWNSIENVIPTLLDAFSEAIGTGADMLICDSTCFSTSTAILCTLLLLKRNLRVEVVEKLCVAARPSVFLSVSHRKGLLSLQSRLDKSRMIRLDNRLRTSPIVSIAF